ncbi:Fur family transcriptional regulator [Chakrabartyella piscis]|uniref:Fur family transcriptional regulator n=1 Tax=Chakrabartyella piscis TaxID=2918914 RepID=UPI00295894BD|nr:transcriptional repressor [Chakrabartyella piscis]
MAYMTKQRRILLDFFSRHPHQIFSVTQILEEFRGEKISTSAIYRNLAELASSGEIEKISRSGTREACYQYVNAVTCQNQIHLVCRKCEKAIHMNPELVEILAHHLLIEDEFVVDKTKTTILGVCKNCRQKTKEESIIGSK